MDTGEAVQIIILIILLLLSAFFSSAETALTTSNKIKMKRLAEEGNKNAALVLKITDNTDKMLSAILIGNNIVNISASSLTTIFIQSVFDVSWAVSVGTGVLTLLVLIFGEITPKTAASNNANNISLRYAKIIWGLMVVLTPVIFIVNKLAGGFMYILGIRNKDKESTFTEEELRTIMNVSHEEGVIEKEEREMINNVFDFGDAEAKDVMVPRIDMCMVDENCSYDELINTFKENKYTRIPVYQESPDNIIGIINIKDLILYRAGDEFKIRNFLREAYYTYEYKKLSELMVEMKKDSVNITIVLDEYGVTAGLITIEDLLEEIVGEIRDEYDYDEEDIIKKITDDEYIVDGQVKLDDINESLGLSLTSEDYDSLGGYIIGYLDRLPIKGDKVVQDNFTLVVDSMIKNRINKIHIYFKKEETENDEEK